MHAEETSPLELEEAAAHLPSTAKRVRESRDEQSSDDEGKQR